MNLDYYKTLLHKDIVNCKSVGPYKGNYKCHINCLEYARRYPEKVKSIVGCLQVFSDNDTSAHFIIELQDGSFIDPTYGIMVDLYSYNIVIERYSVTNFKPHRELRYLKTYLLSLLPWYIRIFANINKI